MARELTLWKPLREIERISREMDKFFDSLFERRPTRRFRFFEEDELFPLVDITETDNDLILRADLPGIDPNDINISLSDGILTIKGEKKQEKEEETEDYHIIERSYGTFTRQIQLPKSIESDQASASYKNGVLKIVLPKKEESKRKEIKISIE